MAVRRKTFFKKTTKSFHAVERRRALHMKRIKRQNINIAGRYSLHFMLQQD